MGIQLKIKCTDTQEICRQIFHINIFRHSPGKGCDFCFKFVPEHTTGTRNNTTGYLSSFEVNADQEIDLTIRVKIHVQPDDVDIKSTGVVEEEPLFLEPDHSQPD